MSNFLKTAASRETSQEIIDVIYRHCQGDEEGCETIWQGDGNECDYLAIWEMVTKNGLTNAKEFCWGAAGYDWYNP